MGWKSFFKRGGDAAAPAAKPVADRADAVQQLRLQARRRLIGAAVLVGLGVIGFPLLFETQPRPIPVDLPIEIPHKEGAAPLTIPATAAPASTTVAQATTTPTREAAPAPAREIITEEAPEQKPVEKPAEKPADRPVDKPVAATPKPVDKPVDRPKPAEPKPAEAKPTVSPAESARVQAMLEGKPASKPAADAASGAGRFIVQVGAYADAKSAQEARMKVEKMGLKTYTQAVETPDGKRIRVRVGPFGTHDEAAKVAAKVRGGGLSTAVLTL